jgi:hypothetical protein
MYDILAARRRGTMCKDNLYLRPVKLSDALLLYQWRNEASARQNSFHTEELIYEEHLQWLMNILGTAASRYFYILMLSDIPIGQVRLSEENQMGLISFSIDKKYRSKGYGRKILCLLEEQVMRENSEFILVGYVKKENAFSQRIFESLGYLQTMETDVFKYEKRLGSINLSCKKETS